MRHRAIPAGYMTVGEVARKMNTTVRTLQYYDKEGLLAPSAESEGGRRLYTDKDIVKLHQIQSMKYLGFTLEDIKTRLVALDTPEQIAEALDVQANEIRGKISSLTEVLNAIEKLRAETMLMDTVDWGKYATIVSLLQKGSLDYWFIKYFDMKTINHFRNYFNEKTSMMMENKWQKICLDTAKLQKNHVTPESPQGQAIAKEFWDYILEFTNGDMSLLPGLMKFSEKREGWDDKWKKKWEDVEDFISKAMGVYCNTHGINPFEGVE